MLSGIHAPFDPINCVLGVLSDRLDFDRRKVCSIKVGLEPFNLDAVYS